MKTFNFWEIFKSTFKIYGVWLQARMYIGIHTHLRNAVPLVWGSLRLALMIIFQKIQSHMVLASISSILNCVFPFRWSSLLSDNISVINTFVIANDCMHLSLIALKPPVAAHTLVFYFFLSSSLLAQQPSFVFPYEPSGMESELKVHSTYSTELLHLLLGAVCWQIWAAILLLGATLSGQRPSMQETRED